MKKYLSLIFAACLAVTSIAQAANAFNITDNGTFPVDLFGITTMDYFDVAEGKKYAISIKGSAFDSGSIDVQEAYVDEVTGGEVWGSIAGKSAITVAEDFQFVAIGNKIRFVVTLVAGSAADIDVLGPSPVVP